MLFCGPLPGLKAQLAIFAYIPSSNGFLLNFWEQEAVNLFH